jgi:SAM-dependent methyltransferase
VARVDYERIGGTYARHRRADSRIAARIEAALGEAQTVVNVGAGSGSYEPADRWVLAVEPSATMRAQRPQGAAPAIAARAEELPLDDDSVDAAMACVTIHHWEPAAAGLLLEPGVEDRVVARLREALESGAWDAAHGHLRERSEFEGALRLVISEPS